MCVLWCCAVQGYDVTQHVLACFGGAGGQHACAIAAALGIRTIFVHRYAGILSAVGIGLAEVVHEAQASRPAPAKPFSRGLELSRARACHGAPALPPPTEGSCVCMQEPCAAKLGKASLPELDRRLGQLEEQARGKLLEQVCIWGRAGSITGVGDGAWAA